MAHPVGGYKDKKGQKVPGVTTIIGRFKETGGLMYWACEQGKAIERGEISHLYDKRDEAGDAGTLAHSLVEHHIANKEHPDFEIDHIGKLALQGYENYLEWESSSNIEIIYQEIGMVSEIYRFGGCPDAIGIDSKGRTCLLDWKTSKGVYTDYLIQLAAYKLLWEENHPDMLITGGFHLAKFGKESADFSHHYWSELDDAEEQFLLFRKSYDLDKLIKRRV